MVALDDLSTGDARQPRRPRRHARGGPILDPAALDARLRRRDRDRAPRGTPVGAARRIADPMASHLANATGTVEVLEAARRARQPARDRGVVVVGVRRQPDAAQARRPRHPAAQPLRGEQARHRVVRARLPAVVRPAGAGVPLLQRVRAAAGRPGTPTPRWCPRSSPPRSAGEPLIVHGDGQQSRDFTFVDTVTEVIADAVDAPVTCDRPGEPRVRHAAPTCSTLDRRAGAGARPRGRGRARGDARRRRAHSQADSTRLHELFPDVAPTALPDALRATVDWFRRGGTRDATDDRQRATRSTCVGASVALVVLLAAARGRRGCSSGCAWDRRCCSASCARAATGARSRW